MQTALAKAYGSWAKVREADHPVAYVRRLMINAHLSWVRRLTNTERVVETFPDAGAGDLQSAHAESDEMRRALLRLSPRVRTAVVLRYVDDLSEADTATLMGCSRSTVNNHVTRGLAAFRAAARPPPPTTSRAPRGAPDEPTSRPRPHRPPARVGRRADPAVDPRRQVADARARNHRQRRGRIVLVAVAIATAAVVLGSAVAVDLLSATPTVTSRIPASARRATTEPATPSTPAPGRPSRGDPRRLGGAQASRASRSPSARRPARHRAAAPRPETAPTLIWNGPQFPTPGSQTSRSGRSSGIVAPRRLRPDHGGRSTEAYVTGLAVRFDRGRGEVAVPAESAPATADVTPEVSPQVRPDVTPDDAGRQTPEATTDGSPRWRRT